MSDAGGATRPPLNGWKEIAAHLGKSVRSVQRWETTLGLPVHRIRTPEGQIVYADRDEIDQWRLRLDSPPTPEPEDPRDPESLPESGPAPVVLPPDAPPGRPPRHSSWVLATGGAALFAAGLIAGWFLSRPSPVAVSVVFTDRGLQGMNQQGAVVWSHQFDRDITQPANVPEPVLVDLDGDGVHEWLVAVRSGLGGQADSSDTLYSFSREGVLKWSVRPDQNLTYPNRLMSAPWHMTDFVVSGSSPRRLWVSFVHHTGSSSFVLGVSASGSPTLRYVQFGRIYTLAHWQTPAGGFLAVGGGSAEHRLPALVLMPEDGPAASMPIADPGRATCRECPPARPHRMLLFPRSELTTVAQERNPYVLNLRTIGPDLEVMTYQGAGHALFVVGPRFSVESFQFMQTYWGAHQAMESKGEIAHTADQCPERRSAAEIRQWTATDGWQQVTVSSGPPRPLATSTPSGQSGVVAARSPAR